METTKLIGLMAAAATVAGCNGFNRVSYTRQMPFGQVLMVDANQRAIFAGEAIEDDDDDDNEDRSRPPTICSEPSPDAITAATLAASGSLEHEQVSAQASLALAQNAASIGIRTPSIQLLRDGMYRLCEAYQNGALSRDEYTRMLGQYQQMVVGLVAIEQLTGTVTAQQVALTSGGANALQINASLESHMRMLQTWEQRREQLRGLIKQIEDHNTQRLAKPEAERGAEHPDTANLQSYKSELAALDTNIPALMNSLRQALDANVSASHVNSGSATFGGAVVEITRNADGTSTTRTTPLASGGDTYNAQTAEVIAKAVRDITFEIIRTGENDRDTPAATPTNAQTQAQAPTDQAEQQPARRRSWFSGIFGRR